MTGSWSQAHLNGNRGHVSDSEGNYPLGRTIKGEWCCLQLLELSN